MRPKRYRSILSEFMSFNDARTYTSETVFTRESLLAITPEDVYRWMNFRAFGEPYPGDDAKPVFARSSTLAYAKKALSCFMPPIRNEGNPTRSELVNKVIKTVKRFEVRREGVQSAARRPIEYEEFINLLELVHSNHDKGSLKHLISSVLTLQWHMITRIDDMMQLKFDSFSPNVQHPHTSLCQLRWSKNISERDAPEQILLGSLDPRVCVLLNLAIHLEMAENSGSSYLFGNPLDGDRVVRRFLQEVFDGEAFHTLKQGNLGTHSLRKGAATYATSYGLPKDFINRRGRWSVQKSVVDVYIDNTQPYPDAVTAGVLTGPLGPCFYVVKDGMRCVTDDLLVNQIGNVIKQKMGEGVARELGIELLWASLVPEVTFGYELVPAVLKQRVVRAYSDAGGNPAVNPVKRAPIQVTGEGAQLQLFELKQGSPGTSSSTPAEHNRNTNPNSMSADTTRKEFTALHSQLFGVQRQLSNVMNEVLRMRVDVQQEHRRMMAIMRRVALQPVARTLTEQDSGARDMAVGGGTGQVVIKLSKRPQDLYQLWHEYEFGLNGTKPANEFTRAERGANKFAYSRRKAFWDVVAYFVRAGLTSDVAIDKIYAAYGRQRPVDGNSDCTSARQEEWWASRTPCISFIQSDCVYKTFSQ